MKLAILFVIVCAVPALKAIRCYICRKTDGSCKNVVADENLNIVACPYGLSTCGTVSKLVNGQNITTAYDCYPHWDDACTNMNGGMVCYCNKDGCNSPLYNKIGSTTGSKSLSLLCLVIVFNLVG